jgi:hypothetical protein
LACEEPRNNVPVRDLKRETCLEKLEAEASEPLRERKSEFFSATVESEDTELVKERRRMSCLAKLLAEPNDPVPDLNSEFFSARLDDGLSETARGLPTPLAIEPATVKVSL